MFERRRRRSDLFRFKYHAWKYAEPIKKEKHCYIKMIERREARKLFQADLLKLHRGMCKVLRFLCNRLVIGGFRLKSGWSVLRTGFWHLKSYHSFSTSLCHAIFHQEYGSFPSRDFLDRVFDRCECFPSDPAAAFGSNYDRRLSKKPLSKYSYEMRRKVPSPFDPQSKT